MQRVILFLILLFPLVSSAQNNLTKSKKQVRKYLKEYLKNNDTLTAALNETDSTLVLSIKQGPTLPADFIYYFDKKGKCNIEKIITYCDSCHSKYLNRVLDIEKYKWKKINENQYISDYKYRMTLELPGNEAEKYFMLIHSEWTKELYQLLIER